MAFELRIERADGGPVHSIALTTRIQVLSPARSYDMETGNRLLELFGPWEQWSSSLRNLLWTQVTATVPAFVDSTRLDLLVPCPFELEIPISKYLNAVREGVIPLEFLFSGTVFYPGGGGGLQITQIPWDRAARFDLPAGTWHELVQSFFQDRAWMQLRRGTMDRLYRYKSRQALPSWDDAICSLLAETE
jgi:hypothetical protein